MSSADAKPELPAGAAQRAAVAAGMVATAAAAALAVSMAIRPIPTNDIGYHLAYGEHFLDTGRIVQTNRFIYTRLDPKMLADPENLGPGCRYEPETNTYRFVNANWLSQVIMAAVGRAAGFNGLVALQAALVAAIFAVLIVTMRRCQVGWQWIAPALLLLAVVSYERFNLKPELFGCLVLAAQWCLLVKPGFGWRRAVALIGLQVLAVNLHSYFLLNLALTGVMFLDALLRWLWRRAVTQADTADLTGRLKWLGIASAGAALACLCSPWLIRGAVMPVETLMYLRKHDIAGGKDRPDDFHPWQKIAEMRAPFGQAYRWDRAFTAYIVLLCLSGTAALAATLRRQWGWLLALAGMAAVSLSTRRNIGPAAPILSPLSVIVLAEAWGRLRRQLSGGRTQRARKARRRRLDRLVRSAGLAVSAAVAALALWWGFAVVTHRFYVSERRTIRFGTGIARFAVPLDEARWINQHQPKGRIFCDFGSSSNLMYFTRPRREMPVLTNTWACPPQVMKWVILCARGRVDFNSVAREYDIGVVVLRLAAVTRPLMARLAGRPDWAVVQVGSRHVVFVGHNGPDAALARAHEVTKQNFQVSAFVERIVEADPAPAAGLRRGGLLLYHMGWLEAAIQVLRTCVDEYDPEYHAALWSLASALMEHGLGKQKSIADFLRQENPGEARKARAAALAAYKEAEQRLQQAIRVKPGYRNAEKHLERIRRRIRALERGAPGTGRRK